MNGAPRSQGRTAVTGAVMSLSPDTAWHAVPAAVVASPHLLTGVAVAASGEIWVVGNVGQQPLAARWDGTAWTLPPGPPEDPALVGAGLQGVALFPGDARPAPDASRPGAGATPSDPTGAGTPSADTTSPAGPPPGLRALPSLTDAGDDRFDGGTERTRRPALRVVPGTAPAGQRAVAVGGGYDRLAGTEVPIVRHWDGRAWTAWDSWSGPGLDSGYVLTDVAAVGADEAWAVGHGFPWGTPAGPVALRWADGDWRPASLPKIPKGKLLAVAAHGPDEVWAVGADDRSGLILRYDGAEWRRAASPATRFPLTDVAVCGSGEAWAVGRDHVLRWDGRRWRRVRAPVTAANTVTALSPEEVWVAGGRGELARFDGRRWETVSAPQPFGTAAVWLASAASGPGAWLVGTRQVTRAGAPDDARTIPVQTRER
ncbi:hypothetical protein ACSNOI_24050 [Actinomadura kijaniata]|uniref:hypothetical protein n=1 Tax=Actinomadura kijaniata TaxID=46161 RepID=UPI003F1DFFED